MANSLATVCNILGIDKVDMTNKIILIEEQHNTNANFVINAILSHSLTKTNSAVCLVLCHNTFSHYHNIGMRLGYNLLKLKEKGQITVVEPMKMMSSDITDLSKNSVDRTQIIPDVGSTECTNIVRNLCERVKNECEEAAKFTESVVLIIDDLSHLLNLGLGVRDTMYFIRYLRSFMELHRSMQLCVLVHTYQRNMETSDTDEIVNILKYMAHLFVSTKPFKTGHSSDASGKLIVRWRTNSIRLKYHCAEETTHLFNLSDWQVRISVMGAMPTLF